MIDRALQVLLLVTVVLALSLIAFMVLRAYGVVHVNDCGRVF